MGALRTNLLLMLAAVVLVTGAATIGVYGDGVLDDGSADPSVEAFSAEMDRRIPRLMERLQVPGAALAIVQEGEVVWTGAYGVADLDTKQPVTAETVFQAGSISKSLTAWGVMLLAERDQIELDAPVERYLSRWAFPPSPYRVEDVTAERLLSHTAGLPFRIGEARPLDDLPAPEELLGGAAGEKPVRLEEEPGREFRYSNPGYSVLELLVEEVSGQPFPDFMEDEVLKPVGMETSGYRLRDASNPDVTTGYTFDGMPVAPDRQGPAGAGGLYTTASDLARFVAATVGSPEDAPGRYLLSEQSVSRMHEPVAPTSGLPHALMSEASGLGHFVETLPSGQRAVGHGGENEGWVGCFFAVPETGDGVVLLTNSRRSYELIARTVRAWAEWQALGPPSFARIHRGVTTGVWIAIVVFLGGTVWLGWRLVRGLMTGARRLAPGARHRWLSRLSGTALAIALLAAWWVSVHDILLIFLPVLTGWLAIVLTAFCLMLVLLATAPRLDP